MKIEFTVEEYASIIAYPLPWWAPEPRNALGRVAGSPGAVVDENGNITGYQINHKSIDHKDLFLLEILRAGWDYISNMTDEEKEYLQTLQMQKDWGAWESIKTQMEEGLVTLEEADIIIWDYVIETAGTLGLTYVEPDEDGVFT